MKIQCPFCGNDDPSLIESTETINVIKSFCIVCSKGWTQVREGFDAWRRQKVG